MGPLVLAPIESASPEAARSVLWPGARPWRSPEALVAQAASHLDLFDEKADLLRAAARFMIARKA